MKKYATVPFICRLKRIGRVIAAPRLKLTHVCTVGFCRDEKSEPLGEAKIKTGTEIRIIDLIATIAALTAFCALLAVILRCVIKAKFPPKE